MSRDGDVALDGQAMAAMAKERQVGGKLLDYWPSRRKWQWGGRITHGTDQDLTRFIAKRV